MPEGDSGLGDTGNSGRTPEPEGKVVPTESTTSSSRVVPDKTWNDGWHPYAELHEIADQKHWEGLPNIDLWIETDLGDGEYEADRAVFAMWDSAGWWRFVGLQPNEGWNNLREDGSFCDDKGNSIDWYPTTITHWRFEPEKPPGAPTGIGSRIASNDP